MCSGDLLELSLFFFPLKVSETYEADTFRLPPLRLARWDE